MITHLDTPFRCQHGNLLETICPTCEAAHNRGIMKEEDEEPLDELIFAEPPPESDEPDATGAHPMESLSRCIAFIEDAGECLDDAQGFLEDARKDAQGWQVVQEALDRLGPLLEAAKAAVKAIEIDATLEGELDAYRREQDERDRE